jgi:4,5-dihydroxyphthalate decarboxylase
VTFEDAHVAGFADPLNARRAAPGQDLQSMLLAGEIDAAVLGNMIADPRFKPLIPDPGTAARRWREKHDGAIQINHMVAVRTSLCRSAPAVIHETYRLLEASKRAAGLPGPPDDLNPFGLDASRHSLEIAIDTALRQGLIRRKLAVEELFEALPPAA